MAKNKAPTKKGLKGAIAKRRAMMDEMSGYGTKKKKVTKKKVAKKK